MKICNVSRTLSASERSRLTSLLSFARSSSCSSRRAVTLICASLRCIWLPASTVFTIHSLDLRTTSCVPPWNTNKMWENNDARSGINGVGQLHGGLRQVVESRALPMRLPRRRRGCARRAMQFKGYTLTPFQVHAVEAIRQGKNVLLSAPTGSGKTLVAEYAVEDAVGKG